jgi:hypothetical protein
MSTSGQSGPESISQQTSTQSKRTKQPFTRHREPEAFETDTNTKTKQETKHEETKPEQHKSEEELANKLKRLQMTEPKHEQSTAQAVVNPRNENFNAQLIGDPGIFTGKRTKFANWWRIMQLHLRYNKVTNPDNKIMIVASKMTGGVAGFHAQHWQDKMLQTDYTADWEKFKKELETMFSFGDRMEIAQSQIEEFKQGGQHINNFIIKFGVLKDTAKTDEQHAIFLLKQHVKHDIIKVILGYPPITIPSELNEWIEAIQSVGKGQESTQTRYDILTPTGVGYGGKGQPMEIGQAKFEWSKDGTPKCYKCDQFGHIGRECSKKFQGVKCHGCGKFGHIVKDCRSKGRMQFKVKVRSMNNKEAITMIEEAKEDFPEGSK